jgi:hypothetical protein
MPEAIPAWTSLCVATGMLVGLVVGVRLLLLARRTRGWPELALGCFAVSISVGNLLTVAALRLEPSLGAGALRLAAAGQLAAVLGNLALAAATRAVFRPGVSWALGLFALLAVGLLAGWAGNALAGAPARLADSSASNLLLQLGRFGVFGWWSVECALLARTLWLRVRIGTADVLTLHRVVFWLAAGLAGAAVIATFLALGWIARLPMHESTFALGVVSVAGIASPVSSYLAFHPPAPYRRWLLARAAHAAAG